MVIDTEYVIRGDVLTNARLAKKDVRIEESNRGGIGFYSDQMPVDLYLRRNLISRSEYRAANKIYRDFFISGQTPGMTINLDPIRGGERNFTQAQLDARDSWRAAMKSIGGAIGQLMVLNVCCYGFWLNDIKYLHYKTSQLAMARFHEALEDLIKYYDLTRNSR